MWRIVGADATVSLSGGKSGSCSHHSGNWRPLYRTDSIVDVGQRPQPILGVVEVEVKHLVLARQHAAVSPIAKLVWFPLAVAELATENDAPTVCYLAPDKPLRLPAGIDLDVHRV